jgi:hypothetical protein
VTWTMENLEYKILFTYNRDCSRVKQKYFQCILEK